MQKNEDGEERSRTCERREGSRRRVPAALRRSTVVLAALRRPGWLIKHKALGSRTSMDYTSHPPLSEGILPSSFSLSSFFHSTLSCSPNAHPAFHLSFITLLPFLSFISRMSETRGATGRRKMSRALFIREELVGRPGLSHTPA